MAFDKLAWCIAHLGEDANWWVDSLSDETHWEMDHLGLIDPHQWEFLEELLSPLRACGFQEEILENAFCKFCIEKELPNERVQFSAVETSLIDTEEKLFLLPYARSDAAERYDELMDHLMQLRVKWLNMAFDFKQALEFEDIEVHFRDQGRGKNMDGNTMNAFEEMASILEYIPDGLEDNEDTSDILEEELEQDTDDVVSDVEDDVWGKELKEDIYRLELAD
jgi:hypothetical protein